MLNNSGSPLDSRKGLHHRSHLIMRDASFPWAKRGSYVKYGLRGKNFTLLKKIDKTTTTTTTNIQVHLPCQFNTKQQENWKPSNDRFYRPKQCHNLINRNGMGRCKAAQGLLTVLVVFIHPLFNTTIRKPNGLFISHYETYGKIFSNWSVIYSNGESFAQCYLQ